MSRNIHFLFRIIFTYLLIYTVYLFLQFPKPRYLKADVKTTRIRLKQAVSLYLRCTVTFNSCVVVSII